MSTRKRRRTEKKKSEIPARDGTNRMQQLSSDVFKHIFLFFRVDRLMRWDHTWWNLFKTCKLFRQIMFKVIPYKLSQPDIFGPIGQPLFRSWFITSRHEMIMIKACLAAAVTKLECKGVKTLRVDIERAKRYAVDDINFLKRFFFTPEEQAAAFPDVDELEFKYTWKRVGEGSEVDICMPPIPAEQLKGFKSLKMIRLLPHLSNQTIDDEERKQYGRNPDVTPLLQYAKELGVGVAVELKCTGYDELMSGDVAIADIFRPVRNEMFVAAVMSRSDVTCAIVPRTEWYTDYEEHAQNLRFQWKWVVRGGPDDTEGIEEDYSDEELRFDGDGNELTDDEEDGLTDDEDDEEYGVAACL